MIDHRRLQRIVSEVQREYGMSGLYEGIYKKFFDHVLTRYTYDSLHRQGDTIKVVTEFGVEDLHGFEVITDALMESMFALARHYDTDIADQALSIAKDIQNVTRDIRELEGQVKAYNNA